MKIVIKCLLALMIVLPSFGQFVMKDSQATVPYGSSGALRVCVWDNYGQPVDNAEVYAYTQPVASYSGFHYHSSGLGRPNIVFDGGGSSEGPKFTMGGCTSFHLSFPQFAGVYYVTTYCTTCMNDATNTFYVKATGYQTWADFPTGGWLGIEPQFPGDKSRPETSDAAHGNLQKYGTQNLITKLEQIGANYYYNLGVPMNGDHNNWLQLIRMSLPWGGWLDDIGQFGAVYWYPANPDPHGDGNQADFLWNCNPAIQAAFQKAILASGCGLQTEYNSLNSDAGDYFVEYWHVTCY